MSPQVPAYKRSVRIDTYRESLWCAKCHQEMVASEMTFGGSSGDGVSHCCPKCHGVSVADMVYPFIVQREADQT